MEGMNLTVALTGASGAILGRELLRALEADARVGRVHFVASENSLRVVAEELGLSGRNDLLEKLLGAAAVKTVQQTDGDIGAAIASGSHPPCTIFSEFAARNEMSIRQRMPNSAIVARRLQCHCFVATIEA